MFNDPAPIPEETPLAVFEPETGCIPAVLIEEEYS